MIEVGYIRVSSRTQVKEGVSLDVQRKEVTELLKKNGCTNIVIFADEGKSARTIEGRDEFIKALDYAIKENAIYFAVYDTSRFARNVGDATAQLKRLKDNGTQFICVTQKFEDSPEGEMLFGIWATLDQYQSSKSGAKIKDSIRALHSQGKFPHTAPLGYKNVRHENGKADIIVHPEYGKYVQEALKGYAYGKLNSEKEIALFLQSKNVQHKWLRYGQKEMHFQLASRLLNKPFYYGYFVDGPTKKLVRHIYPTMISEKEFEMIQKRLRRTNKGKFQYNNPIVKEKFPLSDAMYCPKCGRKFIGYNSRGRNNTYSYYDCKTKKCSGAIRSEIIHKVYENILLSITPKNEHVIQLFKAVFFEQYEVFIKGEIDETKRAENTLKTIQTRQQDILRCLPQTTSPSIRLALESEYDDNTQRIADIEHNNVDYISPKRFEPLFENAKQLLNNPLLTWNTYGTSEKRRFHEWMFPQGITYSKNEGIRTADLCLTYKLICATNNNDSHLVETVGIEPTSKSIT